MKFLAFVLIFILTINTALAQGVPNKDTPKNLTPNSPESEQVIDFADLKPLKEPLIGPQNLDSKKVHFQIKERVKNTDERKSLSLFRDAPRLYDVDSSTATNAVELGWDWLQANQSEDGSWSKTGETKEKDTQAAIELMRWIEQETSQNALDALTWYQLKIENNSDSLARKIFNLSISDDYTDDLSAYLIEQANSSSGGFGYNKYYKEDTLTTALVVKALTQSGYRGEDGTDNTVYIALYKLLVSQNSDGGFGYTSDGESFIYPTEIALDSLLSYDGLTLALTQNSQAIEIDIGSVLDAGFDYLKYHQNTDGSFGSNLDETALAYDLLLRRNDYPTDNEAAVDYLLTSQSADGSFNDLDPYTTALAVKALAKPDLEVGTVSIDTETPLVDATITVPVSNRGYLDANPFTLEVYLEGALFTSYAVPYTLSQNATLNIDIGFTGGFPIGNYDFEFRVVPSNEVGELNPDNNSADFSVHFSNYVGPTPPEWFGASTSSVSGRIRTSWLPSTDPSLSSYKLYIGTTSGTYTRVTGAIAGTTTAVSLAGLAVDTTYYFTLVSFDALGNRGDYSMESTAMAKTTPSANAQIQGTVMGNGTALSGASLSIHTYTNVYTTNSSGTFSSSVYPGHYYFTASHSGYNSLSQEVNAISGSIVNPVFNLEEQDDGIGPDAVTDLTYTEGNGEITLNWTPTSDSDFDHYALYRSSFPITTLDTLSPLTTLSESSISSYVDESIRNGIAYYYAVAVVDQFGNTSSFEPLGPLTGNSAPTLTNLSVEQEETGYIKISYDLDDSENETLEMSLDYFDGSSWVSTSNASGLGQQSSGTEKSILWNAQAEFSGQNTETALIRITANDSQTVNNSTSLESSFFSLDTLGPSLVIDSLETSTRTPLITGSSDEALQSLTVLLNGESYNATLDGLSWSIQVEEDLSDAYYDISASGTDSYGNTGTDASSYELLVEADPLLNASFYAGTGDGFVIGPGSSVWTTLHDALTGGGFNSTGTITSIKTGKSSTGSFSIDRTFLPFDTSGLPDEAEIVSANLSVYVSAKINADNDGDDFITIVNTSQASPTSLVTADYDQVGSISNPVEGTDERKDLTSISTGSYLSFVLNSTGLSWVSKEGFTQLGLREGHDVLNSAFGGASNSSNSIQVRTSNYAGTSFDPILAISYRLPVSNYYNADGSLVALP